MQVEEAIEQLKQLPAGTTIAIQWSTVTDLGFEDTQEVFKALDKAEYRFDGSGFNDDWSTAIEQWL